MEAESISVRVRGRENERGKEEGGRGLGAQRQAEQKNWTGAGEGCIQQWLLTQMHLRRTARAIHH